MIHEEEIQPNQVLTDLAEEELTARLFKYVEPEYNAWRPDYIKTTIECYQFVELNQWEGADMKLLNLAGVPTIAVDRINRSLDVINGIRENTANKARVVKRELGDERVATLLDEVKEYTRYNGGYDEIADEAFDHMLKSGIGIRKIGYDPQGSNGEGEIFYEFVNTEDCGYSKCKSKELDDVRWIWQRQIMDWEDAMMINPDKAGVLKAIKTKLTSEWDKQKTGNNKGLFARDYENLVVTHAEGAYSYPDQVEVWEFWFKHRLPVKKIGSITVNEFGQILPSVRQEAIDYQTTEHESDLGSAVLEEWENYIVATSGGKKNRVLLKNQIGEFSFHPFVGECATRKKGGAPMGFVEHVLPHQKRINISWAQKTAWNNKSIKSPLIAQKGSLDLENGLVQSQLGSILFYEPNTPPPTVNQQPSINLQAIEEGNVARTDMDFAASASEPALRGQADNSTSGIKLSLQQNAAVTPLNKWVKAEKLSELAMGRKELEIIIKKFQPERIARIIGFPKFQELVIGKLDPMSGMPLEPPLQFPLSIDIEHYDVIIQDTALSDFNKQQNFNAALALQQLDPMGMFDDEYLIKTAPLKDVDSALASNSRHKTDIVQQLMGQIQMLQEQLQQTEKLVPKDGKPNRNPSQPANAMRGKNQPQNGQRSMIGGMSPHSPVGVMT